MAVVPLVYCAVVSVLVHSVVGLSVFLTAVVILGLGRLENGIHCPLTVCLPLSPKEKETES